MSATTTTTSSPSKRTRSVPLLTHLYRPPALSPTSEAALVTSLSARLEEKKNTSRITSITSEWCLNIQPTSGVTLTEQEIGKIKWLFGETFDPANTITSTPQLNVTSPSTQILIEIGPRLCYSTPWATNAGSVLQSCGLGPERITRVERSRRILITFQQTATLPPVDMLLDVLHDRMTEQIYPEPLASFSDPTTTTTVPTRTIPLIDTPTPSLAATKRTLKQVSDELGLAFDDWDVEYYSSLFLSEIKRNPTDVELFDLAQSNSEHSRHWFFGGHMVLNGTAKTKTLFQMVKATLQASKSNNSVIAFHDNSSAIIGFESLQLEPSNPTATSRFQPTQKFLHGTLTAETHNFPTGVAPFEGAETGTGGRIRDVQCVGRGAKVVAGTAAYCVGQLHIPNYPLPWETPSLVYPSNLAKPLDVEIQASNGASDYGNKFGEPVVSGFTRSFGLVLPDGTRREWIKPIMFTSGVGFLDRVNEKKGAPSKDMIITKVGGPAYRIGVGGGAASSRVQDSKNAELDFQAVQRGDAEMENKMNRVIRACAELGSNNPVVSIHDQGAGGNGNVLKEICDPCGGDIYLRRLPIGDETLSARELWTAEYQENNAVLLRTESMALFKSLCERESVPYAFVGDVTDTGRVVVMDGIDRTAPVVVDLSLERVLGKMPAKTFESTSQPRDLWQFAFPPHTTLYNSIDRVLRLLSVGSKRFLTNKVDRCVTGLVAQQQCVGPLHTPLADVAVLSQSWFDVKAGVATATGEQPIKGLVNPAAGARMSVGEALTNLIWAKITSLSDVKCRGNWMWAAKMQGEACEMYEACEGLCEALQGVGVGMDGGKDSLSMACRVKDDIVKAPGEICVSVYAMCPDVTLTVTPDFKPTSTPTLLYLIELNNTHTQPRMGGTALAHVCKQIGHLAPDFTEYEGFKSIFAAVQQMLDERLILAGHDRSDGGLICTVLEMAFAGGNGVSVKLDLQGNCIERLFNEELGLVIQVDAAHEARFESVFYSHCQRERTKLTRIGSVHNEPSRIDGTVEVMVDSVMELQDTTAALRDVWESTSFELEKLQCNPACVAQEQAGLATRRSPPHKHTFELVETNQDLVLRRNPELKPRLAVLREEGSNGDREMAAAFFSVGFDVWDVAMNDLRRGTTTLDAFQGIAFVGGFSYADVFGSAKGWAAGVKFNPAVWQQLMAFKRRNNTFSLGVCNGCQLMALLGWVPGVVDGDAAAAVDKFLPDEQQPRFVHNESGRFECRFSSVTVAKSTNCMFLTGMEGSCLGVWLAHGEGRAIFPDTAVLNSIERRGLAPLRYVDDDGKPTQVYPFNPNGSTAAIAALSSPDGRHLAMMPHPERCFRMFQLPWVPQGWNKVVNGPSPWTKLFQNAFVWAEMHKSD